MYNITYQERKGFKMGFGIIVALILVPIVLTNTLKAIPSMLKNLFNGMVVVTGFIILLNGGDFVYGLMLDVGVDVDYKNLFIMKG